MTESSHAYEAVTTKKQKTRTMEKRMSQKTKAASKKLRFPRSSTRSKQERFLR